MALNRFWVQEQRNKIIEGKTIEVTTGNTEAAKWLIEQLAIAGIPFKIHNLGAGVRCITTKTDTCPCCKRSL